MPIRTPITSGMKAFPDKPDSVTKTRRNLALRRSRTVVKTRQIHEHSMDTSTYRREQITKDARMARRQRFNPPISRPAWFSRVILFAGHKSLGGVGGLGRNRARKIKAEAPAGPWVVDLTRNKNGRNGRGVLSATYGRSACAVAWAGGFLILVDPNNALQK